MSCSNCTDCKCEEEHPLEREVECGCVLLDDILIHVCDKHSKQGK